jgi:hypothetical protein
MRAFRVVSICWILLAGGQAARAEWGTTQGDAGHTGYIPVTVSTALPNLLWSRPQTLVQSSLAVGGGDVFFVTHLAGTGWADRFYVVNERSGVVNWTTQMGPNTKTGDPAYANDVVYLQSAKPSVLRGWNVQTQAQVFSTSFVDQGSTYRAPVISNSSLYIGGGYYGGEASSFNTTTASLYWNTNVADAGSYGEATVAVDASNVYLTAGSDLVIVDRNSGALVSKTGTHQETPSGTPMLVGNGGIFYPVDQTGYYLDGSDPASPKQLWSLSGITNGFDSAYANGTIYTEANGSICALNPINGQLEWSLPGGNQPGNLIVTDNVLLAGLGDNTVAISLATHQVLWSVPVVGRMALSDDELFIGSSNSVVAYAVAAVPEPASVLPMSVVAAYLLACRQRRFRNP